MSGLITDVLARYAQSLGAHWPWLMIACFALGGGTVVLRTARPRIAQRVWISALVLALLAGLVLAEQLAWVADDAFISFRYARNLAQGQGLVFNAGERVEGYTNFLWTLLLAGGLALGVTPVAVSLTLSLLSMAATALLASILAARLAADRPFRCLPLAAILLSLSYTFASFGTSGLETMTAGLLALLAVERVERGAYLLGGLCGVLAAMAHPDHMLFYAGLGLVVLGRRRLRPVVAYGLPWVVVYAPYFLWRYNYYGDLFPNTYYTKSGSLTYFTQGWAYLWISGVAAGLLCLLPLVVYGGVRFRRTILAQYVAVAVPLYLVYVAKIGGDFMLGRLIVPVLPPLFALAEASLRDLLARQKPAAWAAGLLAMAVVAVPVEVVHGREKLHHVADERRFYALRRIEPLAIRTHHQRWARGLVRHFVEHGHRPLLGVGCVGIVGYVTGLPIVDRFGLTDPVVARKPLARRARPGHEKQGRAGYMMARGVEVSDRALYPPPFARLTRIRLGRDRGPFHLGWYDRALWKKLRADRGVRAKDIRRWIGRYRPHKPTEAGRDCDLWFMEQYYFARNDDPKRLAKVRARLVESDPGIEAVQGLLLRPPAPEAGWVPRSMFDFEPEGYERWTVQGSAFAAGPATAPRGVQGHVAFAKGAYANSFAADVGDVATGELRSPPFTIVGDALTFLVGGGNHPKKLRVVLEVGGEAVATASGCGTEVMGRRVWNLAPYRGRQARIRLVDRANGDWGHLLVDEVVQWVRASPYPGG